MDDSLRVDKWLWQARFCKSRTLATRLCVQGGVRLNGRPINRAHHAVRPGDVLTFPKDSQIRVIKVMALGLRRGPADEARTLYEDLEPPGLVKEKSFSMRSAVFRDPGSGRPTKADRRAIERLTGRGR
jgi:ribosome-associated heat shock protein Hsp15